MDTAESFDSQSSINEDGKFFTIAALISSMIVLVLEFAGLLILHLTEKFKEVKNSNEGFLVSYKNNFSLYWSMSLNLALTIKID